MDEMKTTDNIRNCPICAERKRLIEELNEIGTNGPLARERKRTNLISDESDKVITEGFVEQLDECPCCRNNDTPCAMNDFGANYEQTTHVHRCGNCGTQLPKDNTKAYKGTFVCSDLGPYENGEIVQPKEAKPIVAHVIKAEEE